MIMVRMNILPKVISFALLCTLIAVYPVARLNYYGNRSGYATGEPYVEAVEDMESFNRTFYEAVSVISTFPKGGKSDELMKYIEEIAPNVKAKRGITIDPYWYEKGEERETGEIIYSSIAVFELIKLEVTDRMHIEIITEQELVIFDSPGIYQQSDEDISTKLIAKVPAFPSNLPVEKAELVLLLPAGVPADEYHLPFVIAELKLNEPSLFDQSDMPSGFWINGEFIPDE